MSKVTLFGALPQNHPHIARMAEALMIELDISEGEELIPLLGHGQESLNSQALEHWILENLIRPDEALTVAVYPILKRKLIETLGLEANDDDNA